MFRSKRILIAAATSFLLLFLAAGTAFAYQPAIDTCLLQYPGDANTSGTISISDISFLIDYVCHDGSAPFPKANGDPNGDCVIDSLDIDYLIAYLYESGPAPVDCTCNNPAKGSCHDTCGYQYPGDANSSGTISISDISLLIGYVCHDGTAPYPLANGDPNGDCVIDSLDIEYLIAYLYEDGPDPVDCTCMNPTKGSCADTCGYQYPGDANNSGTISISDISYLVDYLCHDGPAPMPPCNGDCNGDCVVDSLDIDCLINFLYIYGDPPVDCTCMNPTKGSCADTCDYQYPGDANSSGYLSISDISFLISYLCYDGPAPNPPCNGDPNGDCVIDSLDIQYLIDYLYINGSPPVDCTCMNPAKGDCGSKAPRIDGLDHEAISRVVPDNNMPTTYELGQNNPNPFNPVTEISFALPVASDVVLEVYSITGQKIVTLADQTYPAGRHTVIWDSRDANGASVASGIYLYTIKTETFSASRKMVLLK